MYCKIILTIFLSVIVSIKSNEEEPKCDGIHVNGKFHHKQILAKGINRPYQLSCYKPKDVVFFSYNTGPDDKDTFDIAFIDKEHEKPRKISLLDNGFATAVNEAKEEVYFGDSKGIYIYPMNLTVLVRKDIKDLLNQQILTNMVDNHNIWYIFLKDDDVYFITYPKLKLYKCHFEDGQPWIESVEEINEKIFQFVIDADGDRFITNKTGLYRIKKGSEHRIHIHGNCTVFRGVALDKHGVAHFCGSNSIYTVNKHKNELEEIAHIEHVFGVTFDSHNNMIYSNSHQIVKLIPGHCKKNDTETKKP